MGLNCILLLPLFFLLSASIQIRVLPTEVEDGRTPLYLALESNNRDEAKRLIQGGEDVNETVDLYGCESSLLHVAVRRNEPYVALQLVELGANMYAQNCEGLTALESAIIVGDVEMVDALSSAGYDVDFVGSDLPLILAVKQNESDEVSLLLQLGAGVGLSNDQGEIALVVAAKSGLFEIVEILLKDGADANQVDGKGYSPLYMTAMTGSAECAKLLVKGGALVAFRCAGEFNRTSLHAAVEYGQAGVVSLLLEAGADVMERDAYGKTPLHYSAVWGRVEPARLLLDHNAGVNVKDVFGMTPLHWTGFWDQAGVAGLLLGRGAELEAVSAEGWRVVHYAAFWGSTRLVELLADHGALVNSKTPDGRTALRLALDGHNRDTAALIRRSGGTE